MSYIVTDVGKAGLLPGGSIDWETDDIRLRLVRTSESEIAASVSAMTGLGEPATDTAIAGRIGPTFIEDGNDSRLEYTCTYPDITDVAPGGEFDRAILYKFVTDDSDSIPLLVHGCVPITPDGRPIRVSQASSLGPLSIYLVPPTAPSGLAPVTYSRSSGLTDDLTAALSVMVPRAAATGAPDAGGRMYVVQIGMSNARDYHGASNSLWANVEPFKTGQHNALRFFRGSASGHTAAEWADPNEGQWDYIVTGLSNAGGSALQVLHVDCYMCESFPATKGTMTETQLRAIVENAKDHFPNLVSLDWHTIAPTHLCPDDKVPPAETHANDALMAATVGTIHGVLVDYVQVYSDFDTPNTQHPTSSFPGGIAWEADDYEADGVHPTTQGAAKMALYVSERWWGDAVKAWMKD